MARANTASVSMGRLRQGTAAYGAGQDSLPTDRPGWVAVAAPLPPPPSGRRSCIPIGCRAQLPAGPAAVSPGLVGVNPPACRYYHRPSRTGRRTRPPRGDAHARDRRAHGRPGQPLRRRRLQGPQAADPGQGVPMIRLVIDNLRPAGRTASSSSASASTSHAYGLPRSSPAGRRAAPSSSSTG